jgi:hypothetical protein
MGLMFAMSSTATASRVCLRYANLLYVRSGRDDYAAEVKGIFDQFIKAGLFSDDPFELDLDALFEVPPDPRAIAELVVRRPHLLDPGLINTLTSANAAAVGGREATHFTRRSAYTVTVSAVRSTSSANRIVDARSASS